MTNKLPNAPERAPSVPDQLIVAVVAYKGSMVSAVHGLAEVLEIANRFGQAASGRSFVPLIVDPETALPDTDLAAIAFPPSLTGARPGTDAQLTDWIRRHRERGALACSACAGAFWLGQAGLLDGRPATTHWALEAEFRQAFPKVDLQPERLIVDDGDIVTAGGIMAWTDLALVLIHRFLGRDAVSRTARQMLIDPQGREQIHYRSFQPRLDHGDLKVLLAQRLIDRDLGADLRLDQLAEEAGLAPRTFQRRFQAATGLSPIAYVQRMRVERARSQLEHGNATISEICWSVGYEDPSAFMRLFKATTGLTAAQYRARFAVR